MNLLSKILKVAPIAILAGCGNMNKVKELTIINELDIPRYAETVSIPFGEAEKLLNGKGTEYLEIKDIETGKCMVKQLVDNNFDGKPDELLFQVDIAAKTEKKYVIEVLDKPRLSNSDKGCYTYGRFVPERIDDFAWENDRVAFRVYGPTAQQLVENGQEGGTLSSGVDCWLKKVNYSIIDKWYENNTKTPGYYHIDHGEGYDPYHVGASLGCGGIGVWEDETLYTSKNFTEYRIIANGPIRTIFELDYAPWKTKNSEISIVKRISLDLGSNLSCFEVEFSTRERIENCVIGITLHEKEGVITADSVNGFFSFWEPMDIDELGTAIVINPRVIKGYSNYRTNEPDKSHLFVFSNPIDGKLVYYAGFGWSADGRFQNFKSWNNYLKNFTKCKASPLIVKYN